MTRYGAGVTEYTIELRTRHGPLAAVLVTTTMGRQSSIYRLPGQVQACIEGRLAGDRTEPGPG
ncbi:hypothetical protein P4133_34895 [Pseudomonas aeruginosa]|nr:hypothetical protein [Pseudomonas aeruginosa]